MSTAVVESSVGTFHPAIALETISPSKTNPRKHFDSAELVELAASIKEKGVIQPIVVRPYSNGTSKDHGPLIIWEIIAGERRWRASKIAGVPGIPAIARELDDKAVLEIQVIENLQRSDIHPLDEALGYKELIQKHGYDVDTLAAKVGKSGSYIYQRLKLAELVPAAQKLFQDGIINAGHAILIARLSPEEQQEVITEEEGLLWSDGWFNKNDPHPVSVRALALEIREHLYLDLAKAPWKQNDTKLFPAAGPCSSCPKRSGANPGLFSDIEGKNVCTDRACYNQKLEAFTKRSIHEGGLIQISTEYSGKPKGEGVIAPREYQEIYSKENRCKFTQKAIIVQGHGRGTTKEICIDKTCKAHHSKPNYAASTHDYKAEEAKRKKKQQAEQERRGRIFKAVMEKAPKKLERADLELIAKAAWKRQMNETQRVIMKLHGGFEPQKSQYGFENDKPAFKFIDGATDAELIKLMLATALGPDLSVNAYSETEKPEQLLAIAKRLKVDVAKIDAALKAEQKEKAKKKPKVQTSAKKKSKAADDDDGDAFDRDPLMDDGGGDDEDFE